MSNGGWLESQSMRITTVASVVAVVVLTIWGFTVWADGKHDAAIKRAEVNTAAVAELRANIRLLTQIQAQQADTLEQVAETAQENSKTLIRIEGKLVRIEDKVDDK